MRKDENGNECPSTLGEYRDMCAALAPDDKAVEDLCDCGRNWEDHGNGAQGHEFHSVADQNPYPLQSQRTALTEAKEKVEAGFAELADVFRELFGYDKREPIDFPTFLIQDVNELRAKLTTAESRTERAEKALAVARKRMELDCYCDGLPEGCEPCGTCEALAQINEILNGDP